jgi:hypothetical protein
MPRSDRWKNERCRSCELDTLVAIGPTIVEPHCPLTVRRDIAPPRDLPPRNAFPRSGRGGASRRRRELIDVGGQSEGPVDDGLRTAAERSNGVGELLAIDRMSLRPLLPGVDGVDPLTCAACVRSIFHESEGAVQVTVDSDSCACISHRCGQDAGCRAEADIAGETPVPASSSRRSLPGAHGDEPSLAERADNDHYLPKVGCRARAGGEHRLASSATRNHSASFAEV